MARKDSLDTAERVRLLRDLAFQVRRKRAVDEVLRDFIEQEYRNGRVRTFRPAGDALEGDGVVAALRTLGMLGDEGAVLLAVVLDAKDHRLLAEALTALAGHLEASTT